MKKSEKTQAKRREQMHPTSKAMIERGERMTRRQMGWEIGMQDPYNSCAWCRDHIKRDEIVAEFNEFFGTNVK